MSASRIGRFGSSAFGLSTSVMSMSLTGFCFSSESASGPLKAASTAAVSAVLGTVATSIQERSAKGANALAGVGATTTSRVKKRVAKRVAAKKRAVPKRKANTKKKSRKVAKKKRV